MSNCLDNIIGISRSECECLVADLPQDYNVSTSGLYMDELPECPVSLAAIKSIQDCGRDMGTMLTRARTNALSEFKRDFWMELKAYYTPKAEAYTGDIGKPKGATALNITNTYAGVLLAGKVFRGAVLTVRDVKVTVNADVTFPLLVLRQRRGETDYELVETLTVIGEAAGPKTNTLATELVLPLWDETGKEINYYFLYDLDGSFQPLDNPVSCGCGISEYNLKRYVTPQGVKGNSLSTLNSFSKNTFAHGIVLGVDVRCGGDDIICQALARDESLKVAIEWAILRRAVINLIDLILHSDSINRHNQAKREQMYSDRGKLSGQYRNSVQWIAENMIITMNDCYTCNTQQDPFTVGGIMS